MSGACAHVPVLSTEHRKLKVDLSSVPPNTKSSQTMAESAVVLHQESLEEAVRTEDVISVLEHIDQLAKQRMTVSLLTTTKVGKTVASVKGTEALEQAHGKASTLLKKWKALVRSQQEPEDEDAPASKRAKVAIPDISTAAPQCGSVSSYQALLRRQGKTGSDCKDPPNMPPPEVRVLPPQPVMKRQTDDTLLADDYPNFTPNLTPAEVLQMGSFGGTYFRPIESAVTGSSYSAKDVISEYPDKWFEGLNKNTQVCSSRYNKDVNRYGVKCGGSLGMWESSGWISALDPYGTDSYTCIYAHLRCMHSLQGHGMVMNSCLILHSSRRASGWFQWYCRFYLGRRCSDDERQVQRWLSGHGPKGRFRLQLMNKVIKANTKVDNVAISPVIRQTCQHWGYLLNQRDLDTYRELKGL